MREKLKSQFYKDQIYYWKKQKEEATDPKVIKCCIIEVLHFQLLLGNLNNNTK